MAIGLVTSGSPAKRLAWKPSGSVILAAAWSVGVGASGGRVRVGGREEEQAEREGVHEGFPRGDGVRAAWSDEGHCSVGSTAPPSPVHLYSRVSPPLTAGALPQYLTLPQYLNLCAARLALPRRGRLAIVPPFPSDCENGGVP